MLFFDRFQIVASPQIGFELLYPVVTIFQHDFEFYNAVVRSLADPLPSVIHQILYPIQPVRYVIHLLSKNLSFGLIA